MLHGQLTISSPQPNNHNLRGPVIPISINFQSPHLHLQLDERRDDTIIFSLADDSSPTHTNIQISEELIQEAQMQLCFHVVQSSIANCIPGPIVSTTTTAGSLFRPEPNTPQTLIAWLRPLSQTNLNTFQISEPWESTFLDNDNDEILAFAKSSFTVTNNGAETNTETNINVTNLDSKNFTTNERRKFFDQVYTGSVWSFPDWQHASSPGSGVKSGFGSTLHQTTNIRPYLDSVIANCEIGSVVDIPCGDMNWMVHVKKLPEINYFGGDVSSVVIKEHEVTFAENTQMSFGLVDIIDEDLLEIESIRNMFAADDDDNNNNNNNNKNIMIFVRHLQFHLNVDENMKILKNLSELQNKTTKQVFVMLSTYLRGNGNEGEYLLASGHKINLFGYPFCVRDPISLVSDGDNDLFMGLWELEAGGSLLGARDDECRKCK